MCSEAEVEKVEMVGCAHGCSVAGAVALENGNGGLEGRARNEGVEGCRESGRRLEG